MLKSSKEFVHHKHTELWQCWQTEAFKNSAATILVFSQPPKITQQVLQYRWRRSEKSIAILVALVDQNSAATILVFSQPPKITQQRPPERRTNYVFLPGGVSIAILLPPTRKSIAILVVSTRKRIAILVAPVDQKKVLQYWWRQPEKVLQYWWP